jgi:hypothetical protein
MKVSRKGEVVFDHTSDEFFTSKKKGYSFGKVSDDFKVLE